MNAGQDPARQAALERRYGRLLRCYPPGQREEMLGVLLATARPGQRGPGARQTVNLVACGLAIRVRRALLAGPWQDALAVVSVIAPALMLITAVLDVAVAIRQVVENQASLPAVPLWQADLVSRAGGPVVVMIGWLAVVLLALTGRRRMAAVVACVPLALDLATVLAELVNRTGALSSGLPLFLFTAGLGPVVIASLAACSLAFSAGPRRGLAIAGKRRAGLMIAALSAAFGFTSVVTLVSPDAQFSGLAYNLLGVLAAAAALAVTCARSAAGGRVAVLMAAGLVPGLVSAFASPFAGDLTATAVSLLGTVLVTVLVWPVAIVSWKGQVKRA